MEIENACIIHDVICNNAIDVIRQTLIIANIEMMIMIILDVKKLQSII